MPSTTQTTSAAQRRILALLDRKPEMSASDISAEAFVGMTTLAAGGYLKALRDRRLIHVSGWRKARNGFVTPLYSEGDAEDLPRPKFTDEDRDSEGMRRIVAALKQNGKMTYHEAAKASGLSSNTIKNARYMEILSSQKRIHIAAWRRNRAGPMIAVFAFGGGEDAPKPAPYSTVEKVRRSKARTRARPDDLGVLSQLLRINGSGQV